jgi:hypothetical protein
VPHENDDGGERQSDCSQRDADRGGQARGGESPCLITGANVRAIASHPSPEEGSQDARYHRGNEHVEIHQ